MRHTSSYGYTKIREKRTQSQKIAANSIQPNSSQAEGEAAFLAETTIFRQLDPAEIDALGRKAHAINCPAGRVLYRPGEVGRALFLLKSGRVQLYHLSTDGRKLITATLETGACFGEMPLIDQGLHNSFAEAIEDSSICVLARSELDYVFAHKPAVTFALLQIVGQRLVQIEAQLIDTTFKGTAARLALLLLQLGCHQGENTGEHVVDGLSHEELADRLGVYRETVTSALHELKEAGAIEIGRKKITICNLALLKTLVG